MKQVAITRPSVRQPDFKKRIGPLAKGGITQRGYTTSVDRPRNVCSNEEKL